LHQIDKTQIRNTKAIISLDAIKQNALRIKSSCGGSVKVCAIIKANAYGHGMKEVAVALEKSVDYFGVALVSEGILLRDSGIETPILVLGVIGSEEIESALFSGLTITVPSVEKLNEINQIGIALNIIPKIHLKIDTGMGRIGVQWNRVDEFLSTAKKLNDAKTIYSEGIYSHFADSMDEEYTKLQFERFQEVIAYANEISLTFECVHICSSRSIFLYPEYRMTMVRPGVALYGIEPESTSNILPKEFIPALKWVTQITYFKVLKYGDYVGYGRTYQVKEEYERIVTLPVGYADGFPRRLSNKGFVLIRGRKYPVVGRVCMDQCMVSLGKDGEGYVGDEVVLIGSDSAASISVVDISNCIDTTPHEVTVCISERVPRVFENK
jgi:alanine racemase